MQQECISCVDHAEVLPLAASQIQSTDCPNLSMKHLIAVVTVLYRHLSDGQDKQHSGKRLLGFLFVAL